MSHPKFSIIIAIRNAEQYATKVVSQIKNQTYHNYECIFVNDGSTDDTKKMLQKEIGTDQRFSILNQKNGGPSPARNNGLTASNGEYVIFLDADDDIDHRLLNYVNCRLTQVGTIDILCYNFSTYQNGKRYHTPNINIDILPNKPIFKLSEIKILQLTSLTGFLWCKCFNRKFLKINKLRFINKTKAFGDYVFSLRSLILADKITFVNEVLYFYQQFSSGGMTNNFPKHSTDYLNASKIIHNFLMDRGLYETYKRSYLNSFLICFYETLYRNMQYNTFKTVYQQGKKMAHEYGLYDHDLPYYYNQKERFENCMFTKDANELAYLSYQITMLLRTIKEITREK